MRFPAMRGFTLIELMISVTVLGVLLAIAAPSFNNFFDRYRVKRAADTFSSFLINTKSEAIKRNATVRVVFQTPDSGVTWCAGMTMATTCDCTVGSASPCQIDAVDRLVRGTDFRGILLNNPADNAMFSFTPLRGAVTSGNVQVQSAGGLQIRVTVAGTGRIRLCSPSGSGNIGGYPVCP